MSYLEHSQVGKDELVRAESKKLLKSWKIVAESRYKSGSVTKCYISFLTKPLSFHMILFKCMSENNNFLRYPPHSQKIRQTRGGSDDQNTFPLRWRM